MQSKSKTINCYNCNKYTFETYGQTFLLLKGCTVFAVKNLFCLMWRRNLAKRVRMTARHGSRPCTTKLNHSAPELALNTRGTKWNWSGPRRVVHTSDTPPSDTKHRSASRSSRDTRTLPRRYGTAVNCCRSQSTHLKSSLTGRSRHSRLCLSWYDLSVSFHFVCVNLYNDLQNVHPCAVHLCRAYYALAFRLLLQDSHLQV